MLSRSEYTAALAEIRTLTAKSQPLIRSQKKRLDALNAAVWLGSAADRSMSKRPEEPKAPNSESAAAVAVLPISRALRDLASLLRRQCHIVVTGRGVPLFAMVPIGELVAREES